MKKIIIVMGLGLLASQTIRAQGITTYLSSISATSTGNLPVGNDYWLAANFNTGNNAGGYLLDSIELGMANATGSPSGFTVMLYSIADSQEAGLPGNNLATLNGSLNPVDEGVYTYTPTSNLTLAASTDYFIVVTAQTAVADGAYEWSTSAFFPGSNGWGLSNGILHSSNGTSPWSSPRGE